MTTLLSPASLLWSVLLQGLVALVWVAGAQRWGGRPGPEVSSRWLTAALVLPVALLPARWGWAALGADPRLARIDRWIDAVQTGSLPWAWGAWGLAVGATFLFVMQEALPALAGRRRWTAFERVEDPRLARLEAEVVAAFGPARVARLGLVRVRRLETDLSVAMLHGLRSPTILVSRGLVERLDDDALRAVLAHELAHQVRGGNARLLLVWVLRALQAPSPAALVIFRRLVETQELACDALAARALGTPAALADALVKIRSTAPAGSTPLDRLQQRGELAFTRLRVRALLDAPAHEAPRHAGYGAAALLAGLLWLIA